MANYSNVVLAIDLNDDARKLFDRAFDMVGVDGRLTVLHVMPELEHAYYGAAPYAPVLVSAQELEKQSIELKKDHFRSILAEISVEESDSAFVIGKPSKNIKRYAEEHACDLIVMGTHGRHGLGLLLGSTASGALHGAPCDVLAIRIHK